MQKTYHHRYREARRNERYPQSFTIVELMIVVVILGLLATAVVINVSGYISRSRQERARMDISTLRNAVELFYLQQHRYPTNDEGLAILAERTETTPSGIIAELPSDPWGRPYLYLNPGQHGPYDIMSLGRDGAQGGESEDVDIVSWNLSGEEQENTH
jgi:general secretion pathway protein G